MIDCGKLCNGIVVVIVINKPFFGSLSCSGIEFCALDSRHNRLNIN
jgi:hypothetical protein